MGSIAIGLVHNEPDSELIAHRGALIELSLRLAVTGFVADAQELIRKIYQRCDLKTKDTHELLLQWAQQSVVPAQLLRGIAAAFFYYDDTLLESYIEDLDTPAKSAFAALKDHGPALYVRFEPQLVIPVRKRPRRRSATNFVPPPQPTKPKPREIYGRDGSLNIPPALISGLLVFALILMISEESVDDIVATDVAPFTLGIAVSEDIRGRIVHDIYSPIIERGTVLPASRAKTFHTMHPNQTEILIKVYQGEHPVAERNTALGQVAVQNLPAGHFNSVEIRFSYDLNGLLEVEAVSLTDDVVTRAVIDRSTGKMSAKERARILDRFERLKVHPKNLLPNRVALERGESAYARLLGEQREQLGFVLANFRVALAEDIDVQESREALNRFLHDLQ